MRFDTVRHGRLTPFRIAIIYLAFGFLALFVSDAVLPWLFEDPILGFIQAVKGAVEVLATALLIYLLVRWSLRDLRVHQRAADTAPIGITLTDPDRPDNPLIFVNEKFQSMTGYDEREALGRNCRFLQGAETDQATREELRAAIDEARPVSVDIVNYRRNGEKFWNKLDVAPVRNADGEVTNFVGFQTDITDRKVREERLRVLNRVLRHNFRNKMTVIGGHAEMLESELDDPPESLDRIRTAAANLRSLTDTVRRTESVLDAATDPAALSITEQLPLLIDGFRERYPAATFELDLPGDDVEITGIGVVQAIEEAVENAVKHNDAPSPTVTIEVSRDEPGWLVVEVADDGPGIPDEEVAVLTEGETALRHADRLGIWSIHWIVSLAGGSMTIEDSALGGSCLRLSVPTDGI